jgi:hypothetical protein
VPEEPDLTAEEIEELVRDMEERAARVAQAKAAGAAVNGRAKTRNKKKVTPVSRPSSSSA